MVSVEVSCPVFPSEDPDKIRAALLNIFPTAVLEECDGKIFGPADLEAFSKLIRRQKILDTARNQMQKGTRGKSGRTIFNLNKQVATVGKVSFVDYRTALGTITVTVESDDLDSLIDRVAPMTVNGEEVHRVSFESVRTA